MEIKLQEVTKKLQRKGVSIGPLKKKSITIDDMGNIIDPMTKELIERNSDTE